MKNQQTTPKIFVSYSHDTNEHKEWVASLARRLVTEGDLEVLFDQWDTEFGDDLVKFMERAVVDSDRVLMICSPTYTIKANEGIGGAGYETMIVTSEMVKDQGKNKFIPVIPPSNEDKQVPHCVSTRKRVDLSHASDYDNEFDRLIRELNNLQRTIKPNKSLASRFRLLTDYAVSESITSPPEQSLPYRESFSILNDNNFSSWRKFINNLKDNANELIIILASETQQIRTHDEAMKLANRAASIYSPLFAAACAAIDSGYEGYTSQNALLGDILNPKGWKYEGSSVVADLPHTMGFLYQALVGSKYINNKLFDNSVDLLETPFLMRYMTHPKPLYELSTITTFPRSIGGDLYKGSMFLCNIHNYLPWITESFGDTSQYVSSLITYHAVEYLVMASNMLSKTGTKEDLVRCSPMFLYTNDQLAIDSYQNMMYQRKYLSQIWRSKHIPDESIITEWNKYIKTWSEDIRGNHHILELYHSLIKSIIN